MGSHVVLADCDVDAANQYLIFNPTQDEEQVYIGGHKAVIDYGLCTSCGLCMNYCRFGAISLSNGHGNSLRSIVMFIENLSEEEILKYEIPTGMPLFYSFDGKNIVKA